MSMNEMGRMKNWMEMSLADRQVDSKRVEDFCIFVCLDLLVKKCMHNVCIELCIGIYPGSSTLSLRPDSPCEKFVLL